MGGGEGVPLQALAGWHRRPLSAGAPATAAEVSLGALPRLCGWHQGMEIAGIQQACVLPADDLWLCLSLGLEGMAPRKSQSGFERASAGTSGQWQAEVDEGFREGPSRPLLRTETRGPQRRSRHPAVRRMGGGGGCRAHWAQVFLDKLPFVLKQTTQPVSPVLRFPSAPQHQASQRSPFLPPVLCCAMLPGITHKPCASAQSPETEVTIGPTHPFSLQRTEVCSVCSVCGGRVRSGPGGCL